MSSKDQHSGIEAGIEYILAYVFSIRICLHSWYQLHVGLYLQAESILIELMLVLVGNLLKISIYSFSFIGLNLASSKN